MIRVCEPRIFDSTFDKARPISTSLVSSLCLVSIGVQSGPAGSAPSRRFLPAAVSPMQSFGPGLGVHSFIISGLNPISVGSPSAEITARAVCCSFMRTTAPCVPAICISRILERVGPCIVSTCGLSVLYRRPRNRYRRTRLGMPHPRAGLIVLFSRRIGLLGLRPDSLFVFRGYRHTSPLRVLVKVICS